MKNIYLALLYFTLSALFFLFIITNYITFYISKATSIIVGLPYLFFYYLLTITRILVVLEAYYKREIDRV